jgi:hypothetical protein
LPGHHLHHHPIILEKIWIPSPHAKQANQRAIMALELSSTAIRQSNIKFYQNPDKIKQYPSSQIIYKPAYAHSNSSLTSSLCEKEHRAQNKQ